MIQPLVITLREGVEAALVIGIAIAFLKKSDRSHQISTVYLALAVAVAASVAGAFFLQRVTINQEAFEGWLLLGAAVFVATLVAWMQRAAKGIKQHIEQRLESISSQQRASSVGLFLFVFLMVFREGVETILMLGAVSLNTAGVLHLLGGVVGLSLAVVFGVLFVRGSFRLDLRRFFRMTAVILFCVVFQLTIAGLHELSEAGVLPSSQWEMAVVGPIVSNDVFFFVAIVALAALMVLFDWRSRQGESGLGEAASSAERRRRQWSAQREKLWVGGVCGFAFVFILFITAEYLYAKNQTTLSPAEPVAAENGWVRIPLAALPENTLRRFAYSGERGTVRFIALRLGDRVVAALDACEICGPQGYYQKGVAVFCRNCSAEIFAPTIGLAGGCNPVPIASEVRDEALAIRVGELERGMRFFPAGAALE